METPANKTFERFFKENFPPVYLFLKHYTGDHELAADLAQETFTRILEQNIPLEQCGRAYLYTMARHLYWHHCRHMEVEEEYIASMKQDDEADDNNFLKEVTIQETLQILHAAIDKLPPRTRQVIRLNLEGKTNIEIAESMQVSLNTIKDLKKSAYAILRTLLSKEHLFILLQLIDMTF